MLLNDKEMMMRQEILNVRDRLERRFDRLEKILACLNGVVVALHDDEQAQKYVKAISEIMRGGADYGQKS